MGPRKPQIEPMARCMIVVVVGSLLLLHQREYLRGSLLIVDVGGVGAKVAPPLEFGAPLSTAPEFD